MENQFLEPESPQTETVVPIPQNPFERVIHHAKSVFGGNSFMSSSKQKRNLVVVVALLFLLPTAVVLAAHITNYQPFAGTNQANIFIAPDQQTLPPTSSFAVMINSQRQKVGFAKVELDFDPQKLTLTHEVVASDVLTNVLKATTMAEANQTGKIIIIEGLATSNISQAPSGTFRVGTLYFNPKTAGSASTTLTINTANSQVVSMNAAALALTSTDTTVALNPAPIASPVPLEAVNSSPTSNLAIAKVTMVNVKTGQDMQVMDTSTLITTNIDALPLYTFRFDPSSATVKSVLFSQTADYRPAPITHIDNTTPYSAVGYGGGTYYPWDVGVGLYTITVTPYSLANAKGTAGTPLTFQVHVINNSMVQAQAAPTTSSVAQLQISRVVMVNTKTNQDIQTIDTSKTTTISLAQYPNYTFRYDPSSPVGSVKASYFSDYRPTPATHVDNNAPYSAVGYFGSTYSPWDVGVGNYTLTVIPYSQANAQGTAGQPLTFNVVVVN